MVNYVYDASEADELTVRPGDVLRDVERLPGGWWRGELRGRRGMFPDNFVSVLPDTNNARYVSRSWKTNRYKRLKTIHGSILLRRPLSSSGPLQAVVMMMLMLSQVDTVMSKDWEFKRNVNAQVICCCKSYRIKRIQNKIYTSS